MDPTKVLVMVAAAFNLCVQNSTSVFHQGQGSRPRTKVRIYDCNLHLLTVIN
jgi:hypothetical protein